MLCENAFLGMGCGYHGDRILVAMQAALLKNIRCIPSAMYNGCLVENISSILKSAMIQPRQGSVPPPTTLIRFFVGIN